MDEYRVTYNEVHSLVGRTAGEIMQSGFSPDLIVAIGPSLSNSDCTAKLTAAVP
jgi:hypothetical protein